MGRNVEKGKIRFFQCVLSIGLILISVLTIWMGYSTKNGNPAYAFMEIDKSSITNCQVPVVPGSQSLLVVLLDRSGSLVEGPHPTDPGGYSTSVTKALADLWPGRMAVIPFAGDSTSLPILGPNSLSDPVQQADLKQKVQNYPIGGNTPLEPAMQEALDLINQNNNPAGSRVILITDGNPTGAGANDGPHQESTIRSSLIGQYCQKGIPVSAFGLTIDTTSSDGQDANRLLSDIANGTGTTYTNVTGPEDLARQVVRLYAEWQNLTFVQVNGQGSNFPVSIDPFAQVVSFVTFRSGNQYKVSLIGPNNQPVTTGVQRSTPADAHYEIDKLLISGPIQPGTYTINTAGDPNAQVYELVSSPLQVQLVSPTAKDRDYADKAVTIQAQFLNGNEIITPTASDGARMVAKVTLLVDGRPAGPPTNDVVLTQQSNSPLFSGQTLIYGQPGQLQIELDGTYQNVPRQTSFTLQLLKPLPKPTPQPTPKPTPPCNVSCRVQGILPFAVPVGILLLLALALFVWWFIRSSIPKPKGWVCSEDDDLRRVDLSKFQKPLIRSGEIQVKGNFHFGTAQFEIEFQKNGKTLIRQFGGSSTSVLVGPPDQQVPLDGQPRELRFGDCISPENGETVSYESVPKAAESFW